MPGLVIEPSPPPVSAPPAAPCAPAHPRVAPSVAEAAASPGPGCQRRRKGGDAGVSWPGFELGRRRRVRTDSPSRIRLGHPSSQRSRLTCSGSPQGQWARTALRGAVTITTPHWLFLASAPEGRPLRALAALAVSPTARRDQPPSQMAGVGGLRLFPNLTAGGLFCPPDKDIETQTGFLPMGDLRVPTHPLHLPQPGWGGASPFTWKSSTGWREETQRGASALLCGLSQSSAPGPLARPSLLTLKVPEASPPSPLGFTPSLSLSLIM